MPTGPRPSRRPIPALLLGVLALGLLSCRGASPPREPEAAASAASRDPRTLELVFTYGSEKEAWIRETTEAYNRQGRKTRKGKRIAVTAVPMGSGEAIEELLAGTRKAHLTSPASGAFIALGNAQSRARTGKDLIGPTENLVLSPVVIAMWKPMAEALGWGRKPVGWSDVLALARDPRGWSSVGQAQFGAFRFGHTHPEASNSGLIALLAETYAAAGKSRGLTVQDVAKPEVARFLAGIEKSVVHYGSSTGFFGRKMFERGPGYLSAAVLYESSVIESYDPQYRLPFPVVAIYPKEGTFWSDHPVGVVDREWVSAEHREAAEAYIRFLLEPAQQARAIPHGFRPASVDVPLGAPIDAAHGVDPEGAPDDPRGPVPAGHRVDAAAVAGDEARGERDPRPRRLGQHERGGRRQDRRRARRGAPARGRPLRARPLRAPPLQRSSALGERGRAAEGRAAEPGRRSRLYRRRRRHRPLRRDPRRGRAADEGARRARATGSRPWSS